jgi:hypothetical protein
VAVVCRIPDSIKCQDHTCLHQCCPTAHYLSPETGSCEQIVYDTIPESSWTPDVVNPEDGNIVNVDDLKLFYIYEGLSCAKNFKYDGRRYKLSIYQDGSLEFDGLEFKYDEYCINHVEQIDNITYVPTYWQEAHVCVSDNPCKGDYSVGCPYFKKNYPIYRNIFVSNFSKNGFEFFEKFEKSYIITKLYYLYKYRLQNWPF